MSFDDKTNRWSVAVPLALLVVGGCALLGCFPIPGNFGNAGGDARPEKKIGKADSDALIRLGVSDRDRVREVLGDPSAYSDDGRAWVYDYDVVAGYWIFPLCFGANRGAVERQLVLRFDEDGTLRAYKVTKAWEDVEAFAGRPVPKLYEREEAERLREREAATRPATQAVPAAEGRP